MLPLLGEGEEVKIIDCEQGTLEWLEARSQCATASELDNLVSPTLKLRTGDMPRTYLFRKLAERWLGRPIQSFSGGVMEQGSILEEEALPWYGLRRKCNVRRVGFITTDDGSFGCSPDGLVGTHMGIEIKCPQEHTHVRWLLGGECPTEHYLQVQGGMFVTGFEAWDFVSYCRAFPPLVVRVARDDKAQAVIAEAVQTFNSDMREAWDRLVAANGGAPVRETVQADVDDEETPWF